MTRLILDFPVEVILLIFRYVSIRDVLNIRQTCKNLLEVGRLRSAWHMLLHTHVQLENIPVPRLPRKSLESFTAPQLEKYVQGALRLRRSWGLPSPPISRRLEITCMPSSRIVSLQFLPQRENHRWLLSLALSSAPTERMFVLQCWDLEALPPACVATKMLLGFGSLAVNTDGASTSVLAVQSPYIEIFAIELNSSDPASAFVPAASFPDKAHGLHVFSGTKLLTRDDHARLYLWDIQSPDDQVELRNPGHEPERPLQAIVQDNFAIIVSSAMMEIYGIPEQAFKNHSVIYPAAYHQWQWRLDSICISFQASLAAQSQQLAPINILVRYGSLLPWPINLLHQYMLQLDQSYDPLSNVDATNLPYHAMPVLKRTISSPIRLFAAYHMALGTRGMAVWLDSHTEDYFGQGYRGQRLAGGLLPTDIDTIEDLAQDLESDSLVRPSVFEVSEDDEWVRVALSEEEGKIAVGTYDGLISILEYV